MKRAVLFATMASALHLRADPVTDAGTVLLRLEASSLGLANGASVSAWGPFSQASAANQPLYETANPAFNGRPVVSFDGTDDVMTSATGLTGARTIFAVTRMDNTPDNLDTLFSQGNDRLNVRRNNTNNEYRSPGRGQDGNDFSSNGRFNVNSLPSGGFTVGTAHLLQSVASGPLNYTGMWLGNASSSLSRQWDGDLAELVVYDGVISRDNRVNLENYFIDRYGLSYTPDVTALAAGEGDALTADAAANGTDLAANLFDDRLDTKYFTASLSPTLTYQFTSGRTYLVTSYTVSSANDLPTRDPRDWTLHGSNDGTTWEVLDSRAGEAFATRFLTKTYTFSNAAAYNQYRLQITANNGDASGTQIADLTLHGQLVPEPGTAALLALGLWVLRLQRTQRIF